MKLVVDKKEYTVDYDVTENFSGSLPPYGIKVTYAEGQKSEKIDNVFFTREEADKRCSWLAENKVFPESFKDIMADIML